MRTVTRIYKLRVNMLLNEHSWKIILHCGKGTLLVDYIRFLRDILIIYYIS